MHARFWIIRINVVLILSGGSIDVFRGTSFSIYFEYIQYKKVVALENLPDETYNGAVSRVRRSKRSAPIITEILANIITGKASSRKTGLLSTLQKAKS